MDEVAYDRAVHRKRIASARAICLLEIAIAHGEIAESWLSDAREILAAWEAAHADEAAAIDAPDRSAT